MRPHQPWMISRAALPPFVRTRLHAMLAMTGVQFSLGIATLLSAVPVHLGSAHQTGALTLFTIVLWTLHVSAGASIRPPAFPLAYMLYGTH